MRVFISHSPDNIQLARNLAQALRSYDISTWLDIENVPQGVKWKDEIENALRNANAVIFLIGPENEVSHHQEYEWTTALEESWSDPSKRHISLLIGDKDLPPFLENYLTLKVKNIEDDCDIIARKIIDMLRNDTRDEVEIKLDEIESLDQWLSNFKNFKNELENLKRSQKELELNKSILDDALKYNIKKFGSRNPNIIKILLNQAMILKELGDFEGARELLEKALEIYEELYGWDNPSVANIVNNIGYIYKDLGNLEKATEYFNRALEIDNKIYSPNHPEIATNVKNLGDVLRAQGELENAREHYKRALKIEETFYGPYNPNVATAANDLGSVLRDMGNLEDAKRLYERALEIDEKVYGPDHPSVAQEFNNLGDIHKALGNFEMAKKYFEKALSIDEKVYGPYHPRTTSIKSKLDVLLKDINSLNGLVTESKFEF